jgi:hypothetical protein
LAGTLLPPSIFGNGPWKWAVASFYAWIFWRRMKQDSRLDPPRIQLSFVILIAVLAIVNFAVLLSDQGWSRPSGTLLREYWMVSVLPPVLLCAFGFSHLKERRFRARLWYYTLSYAWIGFGNLPLVGEWV